MFSMNYLDKKMLRISIRYFFSFLHLFTF